MPTDSTVIYTRKQGSSVFKFCVQNKKLIAEHTKDNHVEQLPIDRIPIEFQMDLNEEKITRLKAMFEQCYFGIQGGVVLIHARGLGGWGDALHAGFDYRDPKKISYPGYDLFLMSVNDASELPPLQTSSLDQKLPLLVLINGINKICIYYIDQEDGCKKQKTFNVDDFECVKHLRFPLVGEVFKLKSSSALGNFYAQISSKVKHNPYIIYFDEELSSIGGGTHDWACSVGFGMLLRDKAANKIFCGTIIGSANKSVDSGDTSPTNIVSSYRQYSQSYHFSVFEYPAGYFGDTRLFHAVNHLANAIELFKTDRFESLKELGRGLHPLQDIFAHGDSFVSKLQVGLTKYDIFHHFGTAEQAHADDVTGSDENVLDKGFNQRYINTKIISYIYLWIYKDIVSKFVSDGFEEEIEEIPAERSGVIDERGQKVTLTRDRLMQYILTDEEIKKLQEKLKDKYEELTRTRQSLIFQLAKYFTDDAFRVTLRGFFDTIDLILNPTAQQQLCYDINIKLTTMFDLYPHTKGMDMYWPKKFHILNDGGGLLVLDEIQRRASIFRGVFNETPSITDKLVHIEYRFVSKWQAGLEHKIETGDLNSIQEQLCALYEETRQISEYRVSPDVNRTLPVIHELPRATIPVPL